MKYIVIISILFTLLVGCKTKTVYVPVKEIEKEYINKIQHDSIYLSDSVFVDRWRSNDTVYQIKEKYKYLYKNKIIVDTVTNIIEKEIPYPVEGDTKYIEHDLSFLEKFQIYGFRIFAFLILGYLAFRYRNKIITFMRKIIFRI